MQIPQLGDRPIAESWDLTPCRSGTCDSLQNYRGVDSTDRSAGAGLLHVTSAEYGWAIVPVQASGARLAAREYVGLIWGRQTNGIEVYKERSEALWLGLIPNSGNCPPTNTTSQAAHSTRPTCPTPIR